MHLDEQRIDCPYCGERLTVLIDDSDLGVDYIEDCQVCCRPMVMTASVDADGDTLLSARREDD